MPEVIWEHDTRVWTQRLTREKPGEFVLRRRIRESRPDAVIVRHSSTARIASSARGGKGAVIAARPSGDGAAVYALHSQMQLAAALWPEPQQQGCDVFDELGILLAEVHSAPGSSSEYDSPHLLRLRKHLTSGSETNSGIFLATLRPAWLASLKAWASNLPSGSVVSHGGWSLGSVFHSPNSELIEVPIGAELTFSVPEFDLGWMIGELAEYAYLAELGGTSGSRYDEMASALLSRYIDETRHQLDPSWLQRFMALRVTLHLCDYVESFVPHSSLKVYPPFIGSLVERSWALASENPIAPTSSATATPNHHYPPEETT